MTSTPHTQSDSYAHKSESSSHNNQLLTSYSWNERLHCNATFATWERLENMVGVLAWLGAGVDMYKLRNQIRYRFLCRIINNFYYRITCIRSGGHFHAVRIFIAPSNPFECDLQLSPLLLCKATELLINGPSKPSAIIRSGKQVYHF